MALVKAIAGTRKPFVVVLMNGRPLTIEELATIAPAILVTWRPGTMGGPAVADVLFGDVNPNWKQPGKPQPFPDARQQYTARYIDSPNEPLYSFGFGLGYTTFQFSNLRSNATCLQAADSIKVSVDVKNTGKREGDEVVQLYVRDVAASVARPLRHLQVFKKIHLAVGEKKQVDFVLGKKELGFLDINWHWTVEAGRFMVYVGNSSDTTLSLNFTVSNTYTEIPKVPLSHQ
ncbi:hypothetical protein RvY_12236 [Ramazzottius varieornatus]|uniref:beta-glucosidase n=1 Tax=Ramazzottius varieornatus TaxID=947166 RepID=A0A1D1VIW4_RAMVA|nr:hypothetical protein RvY_12236 [Ramazzottius varieornatus]